MTKGQRLGEWQDNCNIFYISEAINFPNYYIHQKINLQSALIMIMITYHKT